MSLTILERKIVVKALHNGLYSLVDNLGQVFRHFFKP
jgi:hypothetical protein